MTRLTNWLLPHRAPTINDCEREPIHIPGAIQPHVHVLVCERGTDTITRCSANLPAWLGRAQEQIVGAALASVLGTTDLLEQLDDQADGAPVWITAPVGAKPCDLLAHNVGEHTIIEIEPRQHTAADVEPLALRLDHATEQIGRWQTQAELERGLVDLVQALTGYDRVMYYAFDEAWHGEVKAETTSGEPTRFLGLRFPAGDIPAQARRLYTLTLIRTVGDTQQPGVPLLPEVEDLEQRVNLAWTHARSVSPIHLEYMRNMDVAASFSMSLLVDGQLSAMVVCHHHTPRVLPYPLRAGARLIARVASHQLQAIARYQWHAEQTVRGGALVRFLHHTVTAPSTEAMLEACATDAFALVDADACCVAHGATIAHRGADLPAELVGPLQSLVAHRTEPFTSDTLSTTLKGETGLYQGALVQALGPDSFVVWLRFERVHTVSWGGNPRHEPASEPHLAPRASFERWQEEVRGTSRPWREADRNVARALRDALRPVFGVPKGADPADLDVQIRQIARQVERLELSNRRLQRSNEVLEEFAAAAGHDLRTPLRTIRGFVDLIRTQMGDTQAELTRYWPPILRGVDAMQDLLNGLLDYSRIAGIDERGTVDLASVVDRALEILAPEIERANGTVVVQPPLPEVRGDPSQLTRLFQNMLDNAIKYRRPDAPLHIQVSAQRQPMSWEIRVKDNGRGIPETSLDQIFAPFRRVDPGAGPGVGLGLPLCRRIATEHGGTLSVTSVLGEGSTFTLVLPAP